MGRFQLRHALQAAGAAAVLVGLAGGVSAQEKEIVVGSPTPASINLANFTAAMELGFFAQEGLKVKVQDFQGSSLVMSQVINKSIDIGGAGGEPLVVANQPGKQPLPLKFFYNSLRNYIWEFVALPDSPMNGVADLKGKKLGVGSLGNAHMPATRLILREAGLAPNDVQILPIGLGGVAFKALTDGQVDAYQTFTGNIAFYEATGAKLKRVKLDPKFADVFSYAYFVHEDTLKQQPKMLAGFGRAIAKGTLTCKIATEWCVKTFWKYYPQIKPTEVTDKEIARQVFILSENLKSYLYFPAGKPQRFGDFPDGVWKQLIDILHAGGEIATADVNPQNFYTNELVAQINDFDVAAVEAKAKELK